MIRGQDDKLFIGFRVDCIAMPTTLLVDSFTGGLVSPPYFLAVPKSKYFNNLTCDLQKSIFGLI